MGIKTIRKSRLASKYYMPPEILLDEEDIKQLEQYGWFSISDTGYAYCIQNRKVIYLHRLLCGVSDVGLIVDHIDGNKLNNHKSNLRLVTALTNVNNKPTLKGYTFDKTTGWFRSSIRVDKKRIHLGNFRTAEEAESAYRKAELKYYPKELYANRYQT